MTFFNPRPKHNVILLTGKAKDKLRDQCAMLANYLCYYCREFVKHGHMAHIRPRKIGGDIITNVRWKCWRCHLEREHIEGKK